MANTYVDYTATAGQTDFAFSFPYLEDSHVVVEVEGVDQTLTTNYTIETSPAQKIVLSSPTTAIAGGELVRVKRVSDPSTNLVDFVNGSVLTETELDRAYLHNRYLAEEAYDGVNAGLGELEGSTNYNANNKQIKNLADGTLATDAVNKGYVDGQVALTNTNLAGFFKSTHTGNAVDNVFTLSFTPQTTEAEAYIVSIDGLVQVPDTDYTIGATDITFNTIPANSAEICVVATAAASVATVNEAQVTATGSSQARNLADRFADVVNVLDYGAVASTGTDNSAAFKAAIKAANGKLVVVPAGEYEISSGVDGVADSVSTLRLYAVGATILFDGTTFNFLSNIDTLEIEGGTYGSNTYDLTSGKVVYYDTSTTYSTLAIKDAIFQTDGTQEGAIEIDTACSVNEVTIDNCEFRNFSKKVLLLRSNSVDSTESRYKVTNCYFKNLGNSGGHACSAIIIGSNIDRVSSVEVSGNTIRNVLVSNSSGEDVHAILVYGESAVISGNHIENVKSDHGDDAEAIYVKCAFSRITNNYVLNGGNSHDGAISVKGRGVEGADQFSDYTLVSNNVVEFTDIDFDCPALGVQRSHCIVSNNILKDLRSTRTALNYSHAIALGTAVEGVSNVVVSNNVINGFRDFIGSGIVLGSASFYARLTDDIIVESNTVTNLKGGYGFYYRNDARIDTRPMTFASSDSSITLSAGEFDPTIHAAGKVITVQGTSSNDGDYTIASYVDHTKVTLTTSVTNESHGGATIIRKNTGPIKIVGNNLSGDGGLFGIRNITGGAKTSSLEIANNTFKGFNYVYRLDLANAINELLLTDNVYTYNTAVKYGITADSIIEGDRDQGTWTPTWSGTGITYSEQIGNWYVSGPLVYINFYIKFQGTMPSTTAEIALPQNPMTLGTSDVNFATKAAKYVNGKLTNANNFQIMARNGSVLRFYNENGSVQYDVDELFNNASGATYNEISGQLMFQKSLLSGE